MFDLYGGKRAWILPPGPNHKAQVNQARNNAASGHLDWYCGKEPTVRKLAGREHARDRNVRHRLGNFIAIGA
jgi:hypothetical protein